MENRIREALKGIDISALSHEEHKTIRRIAYLSKKAVAGKKIIEKKSSAVGELKCKWETAIKAFEEWIPVTYSTNLLTYSMARYRLMKSWEKYKSQNKDAEGKHIAIKKVQDGLMEVTVYDIDSAEITPGLRLTKNRVRQQNIAMSKLNHNEI